MLRAASLICSTPLAASTPCRLCVGVVSRQMNVSGGRQGGLLRTLLGLLRVDFVSSKVKAMESWGAALGDASVGDPPDPAGEKMAARIALSAS